MTLRLTSWPIFSRTRKLTFLIIFKNGEEGRGSLKPKSWMNSFLNGFWNPYCWASKLCFLSSYFTSFSFVHCYPRPNWSMNLVKIRWNNLNLIESSIRDFDEHHKWKVVTWSAGSSPVFPSNFGNSEGRLVGTGGQPGLYRIGSLVNFERSGKFNVSRNGKQGGAWEFHPP